MGFRHVAKRENDYFIVIQFSGVCKLDSGGGEHWQAVLGALLGNFPHLVKVFLGSTD